MTRAIPDGLTEEHIELAIQDFDDGIEHGFKKPTKYELVYKGKRYPPKAIVGLAFRHLTGEILGPREFSGGEQPSQANAVLRGLGFDVERKDDQLTKMQIRILRALAGNKHWLSRKEIGDRIRARLGVSEGFEKGYSAAMGAPTTGNLAPQSLEGRGYLAHRQNGSALEYKITEEGKLALGQVDDLDEVAEELEELVSRLDEENYFDPSTIQDQRERKLREIAQRRGQPAFRANLISAYGSRCAITGCDSEWALEAAHITPYLGPQSNHVSNGLLVRADIHTLFDLNLIGIDPESLTAVLAEPLCGSCYDEFDGITLKLPEVPGDRPSKAALEQRWAVFDQS